MHIARTSKFKLFDPHAIMPHQSNRRIVNHDAKRIVLRLKVRGRDSDQGICQLAIVDSSLLTSYRTGDIAKKIAPSLRSSASKPISQC